jgi:hypothetical protein
MPVRLHCYSSSPYRGEESEKLRLSLSVISDSDLMPTLPNLPNDPLLLFRLQHSHSNMDDKNYQELESYQKQPLPRWADERTESKQKWRRPLLALIALSALAIYTLNPTYQTSKSSLRCPYQPAPLHPKLEWTPSDAQLDRSADLLAQAVVCHSLATELTR